MAYLFVHNDGVVYPDAELVLPNSGGHINLRKYFSRYHGGVIVPPEDYASHNIYPVHTLPRPDYHPYKQRVIQQLVFNPEKARIDLVPQVEDLLRVESRALYGSWTLPRHWMQWIIHRNNWDTWLSELQKQLQVQHATWAGEPNRSDAALAIYPDFIQFLHREELSLAETIAWVNNGLGYAQALGLDSVFSAQQTPSEAVLISSWDEAWEKERTAA